MNQAMPANQTAAHASAVVPGALLGDDCKQAIPRLLTKDEIRELSVIDSRKYTAAVVVEYAQIGLAIWLSMTFPNPFVYVLAVIVIGSRIYNLGGLMHEACHYRGYRNRLLNDIVGEIVAFPTTASMRGYRNSHFTHHRELNSDLDPDWTRNYGFEEYEFPATRGRIATRVLSYLTGLRTYASLKSFHKNPQTRMVPLGITLARYAVLLAIIASSIVWGFWKEVLLYWLVPVVTVFTALRYIRTVAEHYVVEHTNVFNESRTILASPFENWLLSSWGLNYHLEHHLFPGITCFNLAKAHTILMTREPFRSNAHITHGYFTGLFRECVMGVKTQTAVPAE